MTSGQNIDADLFNAFLESNNPKYPWSVLLSNGFFICLQYNTYRVSVDGLVNLFYYSVLPSMDG